MNLRYLCAVLTLLALLCSTGCNCGRVFNRSSACCPPTAVGAAPCCGEPTPVVAGPVGAQSFSVQPPCGTNGIH